MVVGRGCKNNEYPIDSARGKSLPFIFWYLLLWYLCVCNLPLLLLPFHLLFAENTSACVVAVGGIPYILPPQLKCHKNVTLLLKCASILPLNIASLTVYFCKQDFLDLNRPLTQQHQRLEVGDGHRYMHRLHDVLQFLDTSLKKSHC